MAKTIIFLTVLLGILSGCGEHIQDPILAVTFGPPQNVRALSVDAASVSLHWDAGVGSADTTFLGYIITRGGVEDTIPKSNLGYLASPLSPGMSSFILHSYQSDGPRSDGVSISWAPAARFEAPEVVTEYYVQLPMRLSGFNVGSETTDPFPYALDPVDSTVLNVLDLYLFGGSGQVDDSLALWSMDLFRSDLRKARFSIISDSSANLDFPRSSFPEEATFTNDRVTVRHNRIFYLRITGNSRLDTLYARVHVKIVPGLVFPSRQVEIRVSLQRVPGVPFACNNQPLLGGVCRAAESAHCCYTERTT